MKKYFKVSAMMLGMATLALTSCSNEEEMGDGNLQRHITVKIGRPVDDEATRAILSEDEGSLTAEWSVGDKVAVFNASTGTKLGVLTLSSGDGSSYATFEGELSGLHEGNMRFAFAHVGTVVDYAAIPNNYVHSVAQQTGTLAALGEHDALTSVKEVNVTETGVYVDDFGLNRDVTFAHFSLDFGDVQVSDPITVSVSGEGVMNAAPVNMTTGAFELENATEGAISATATASGTKGELYVALIPGTMTLTFNASVAGKTYEGSLSAATLNAGKYIRTASGDGINVPMTEVIDDNPGNTDNWPTGGETVDPTWQTGTLTKVADADGWTVNVDIYGNGGWATYITYNNNAIKSRLLSSLPANSICYFQWGRWLGFPSSAKNTHFNDGGSASGSYPSSGQYINGVNIYDTNLGYIWDSGLVVAYGTCWMGNTSWTPARANNCSFMFGKVSSGAGSLDYVGANEQCTWYDRSGNPCPDGYRIPTAEELAVFIPTGGTVNGSCAEVKTINGVKYAMQWTVAKNGNFPYVGFKSVRTTEDTVSVGDAIFNDAKEVRLYAYGYLDNSCTVGGLYDTGLYWSSESGTNEVSGTNGLGGKALLIEFSGSTKAEMAMYVAPRSFGGCIMPIRDVNAKATPLTPWFPVTISY